MNRLASVAVMVAMLAVNPAAWADGWRSQGNPGHGNPGQWHGNPGQWHGNSGWHGNPGWHGGYRPYPGYGYYRPYYAHGYYPYRPYYYRPVGYPYPYYGGYYGYPYYHHNNDNHSDWPAYLAGGLIVGALLTNAYNNSHATNAYAYPQTTPATPIGSVQGRHLLRDLNGKCYERQTDANGNEMRTELPPSECNW